MRHLWSLLVVIATAHVVQAADWPQWLGPRRDGSSTEKVAPWGSDLKVLWKQPVGEGHSSPVVAGGKVYLFTKKRDNNDEVIQAFDAATGEPLWSKAYNRGPFKSLFGNGPRGTPAVAGGKIYTFGITGILSCLDANNGERLWQVDTLKEYDAKNLFFGTSCSPIIEGDRVVVNVGAQGASLVAFNKDTREEVWKSLDDPASYSSPIAIGEGDDRRLVFLTGKRLVAVSPKDGSVTWEFPLVDKLAESSTTPVLAGDVMFASSITYGGVGLKLESPTKLGEKLWHDENLTCYFSTPIAVGKELYVVAGTKPPALFNQATLHCLDLATGKKHWTGRKVGSYHASLLRTGDDKLLLLEEVGNLVLLDPTPKEYRELARAKICGNTWAHPALADGRLYVRDDRELVCVELK
jgi:outer membrane protein assembly factor BamB